jgi:hypothetical protein
MEQEGVVKFDLDFQAGLPPSGPGLEELGAWRRILFDLGLVGQDPERYGGYGYGNLSCRVPPFDAPPERRGFVITGTQTGGLAKPGPEHYCLVTRCRPEHNAVEATGPLPPSSEALTHGALYVQDAAITHVFHVHAPLIWQRAAALGIPITRPEVPYGTPAMAAETTRLLAETDAATRGLFAMGGHQDGVVALGSSAKEAGCRLLALYAEALAGG